MADFGTISSIKSLPIPAGPHVRDFDERQKAIKQAARAAAKAKKAPEARVEKTTTNVAVSRKNHFKQMIIIPAAIDALFGMTADERFAEVQRVCERDEVEALNTYVAPLTNWLNDLDYVLDNYAEVVDALEDHFNKPGRPEATRATWGDLAFDSETIKYIDEKFGYKTDMAISWGGICHVFFNCSIRTMQRRKAFQSMVTSGETIIPRKKKRKSSGGPGSGTENIDQAEYTEAKNIASIAVKWSAENPDNHEAQAIMKIAAERANRLAQNTPSFERKSDANSVIAAGETQPIAMPEHAPISQTATYGDWQNHCLPAPDFERKYFKEAAQSFKDRLSYAFEGGAFKRILAALKEKPQVSSNSHDFSQIAVLLRGAADNLNLLAAAIITSLIQPPHSGLEPAPELVQHLEEQPAQQDSSDLAASPNQKPGPRESEPESPPPNTSTLASEQREKSRGKYTARKTATGYGVFVAGEQGCVVNGMPTMDAAWDQIEKLKAAGSLLGSGTSHERR